MLDHKDPVASIIPAMSLDSPSDNAMAAMSRLALGPVNTDYYLKVFERFDDTGRTTTTWNWAACLCTLNWMLFRQLWGAALVYVAAAEGLALIVFGVGRSFLHWPVGIELGVLGAFAVLAFAVPGLYGNAILYTDTRKRIARALAASRTVPEACALLEKQASSRKRLQVLVLANVVLGLAALIAYLALSPSDVKPLALEPAVTVAQATAAAQAASATKPVGAMPVPEAVKLPLFDAAVNSGVRAAINMLQLACGADLDGVLGPRTLLAVQSMPPERVAARLNGARLDYMTRAPGWPVYSRGWARRIASMLAA